MAAFKLVHYVLDPNRREWLHIETFVSNADHLERELKTMIKGKSIVIDFLAPNGDLLNLGIGGPVGYAAFATADMLREGRTMAAAGTVSDSVPEWVEFEMGGTPTPISRDALVNADELVTIAKTFLETGKPDPKFDWE